MNNNPRETLLIETIRELAGELGAFEDRLGVLPDSEKYADEVMSGLATGVLEILGNDASKLLQFFACCIIQCSGPMDDRLKTVFERVLSVALEKPDPT